MELAFGGVLVTIFLAGFGYLATEIKGSPAEAGRGRRSRPASRRSRPGSQH